jgi:DNA polymerase V
MTRGGKRSGAGRPKGTGKYGEATIPVRVPASMVGEVHAWVNRKGDAIPLFTETVRAGLPTAAEGTVDQRVNLHDMLVQHADSTFTVRVQGPSMIDAGMDEGDLLVVDRSLPATNGKIVVAAVDGDLTVKTLRRGASAVELWPANPDFDVITVGPEQSLEILGVVTTVIRQL